MPAGRHPPGHRAVSRAAGTSRAAAEAALVTAARAGDQHAFTALVDRYRRELELHCYRMLGSFEDAEDAVQESLLRAWRKRDLFSGRSTFRAWLYGIATNCCLDMLERRSRRLLPPDVAPPGDPHGELEWPDIPWLEPYPDRLLDEIVDEDDGPQETIVARETIELVFLAAIQHLPPRQRAVLILRDVLGWRAREASEVMGMSVIASNSALQRARATVREYLPERRLDWPLSASAEEDERVLLDRYMGAWNTADVDGLVALLKEDARLAMPPTSTWFKGREAIATALSRYPLAHGAERLIHIPTRANRQPAFAVFMRGDADPAPRAHAVEVLRIEDGQIADIVIFLHPQLVHAFAVAQSA